MEKKVITLGFYDNGTGKHQSNTVYSSMGMIPALTTITGGGTQQIKVLRKWRKHLTDNKPDKHALNGTERNGTERNGTERNGTERNGTGLYPSSHQ